jgi:GT2 family glycosyltransferase
MIGVPVHRAIEFKVFESFIRMTNMKSSIEYSFAMVSNSLIYDAREYIASEFLKSDAEFLMFIDSDMTFHPQSVEFLARHDKEFVTAKAFKRVKPFQPCFYTKVEMKDGEPHLETPVKYGEGLLPIEGAGLACALIKRSAFDNIQAPYFFPFPHVGEDLTFCLKLKEAGVKMYCDTTLQFGHLGHFEVFERDFFEEFRKMEEEQKK